MRIIGGAWKRTKLPVADSPGLRPTPDRVRETVFNWLGQSMAGWRCLDAFAGTGALGFEAASRGAAEVVLIEREAPLVARLQSIQAKLGAHAVGIERADALAWMARSTPSRFDIVFLDPPFDSPLLLPSLAESARLVVDDGFVYVESPVPLDADALGPALAPWRASRAGAVSFQLLRRLARDAR